jgi:dephospho-CoA kinase
MLKIGLTGGIGSGKSTVARIFEVLGIPVYYADDAAKNLMNEDELLKTEIEKEFGAASYVDGKLDRAYISSIVFKDKEKLARLNALVHPATIRSAEKWMNAQQSLYTIKEAALIFESGSQEHLDFVIGVQAPRALRIHRVMQRDNVSSEEVSRRMQNQIEDDIKMKLCDFVVHNNEEELLIPQVITLHEKLLGMASTKK